MVYRKNGRSFLHLVSEYGAENILGTFFPTQTEKIINPPTNTLLFSESFLSRRRSLIRVLESAESLVASECLENPEWVIELLKSHLQAFDLNIAAADDNLTACHFAVLGGHQNILASLALAGAMVTLFSFIYLFIYLFDDDNFLRSKKEQLSWI